MIRPAGHPKATRHVGAPDVGSATLNVTGRAVSARAGWLPQVVVINEALARAAFRERDPIGLVIIAGYDSMDPMTIVGA
jgi:hypothetical protein